VAHRIVRICADGAYSGRREYSYNLQATSYKTCEGGGEGGGEKPGPGNPRRSVVSASSAFYEASDRTRTPIANGADCTPARTTDVAQPGRDLRGLRLLVKKPNRHDRLLHFLIGCSAKYRHIAGAAIVFDLFHIFQECHIFFRDFKIDS